MPEAKRKTGDPGVVIRETFFPEGSIIWQNYSKNALNIARYGSFMNRKKEIIKLTLIRIFENFAKKLH